MNTAHRLSKTWDAVGAIRHPGSSRARPSVVWLPHLNRVSIAGERVKRGGSVFSDTAIGGRTAVHSPCGRSRSDAKTKTKPFPRVKARVALDALRGEKTIVELAKLHDVRPHQITGWKNELLERAAEIFGGATGGADPAADREKIQELR